MGSGQSNAAALDVQAEDRYQRQDLSINKNLSLGLTDEDVERIHDAYMSLVDVDEGNGIVNTLKLKEAVMFLNQQEIDAIVSGQIRGYIEAVEHSMKDPSLLKVAKVGAGPADEEEQQMIVEVLEEQPEGD